eukprot:105203-Amorphochlora_amoeboformis.AAC.1
MSHTFLAHDLEYVVGGLHIVEDPGHQDSRSKRHRDGLNVPKHTEQSRVSVNGCIEEEVVDGDVEKLFNGHVGQSHTIERD